MNSIRSGMGMLAVAAVVLGAAVTWSADPLRGDRSEGSKRISVAEARERAKLMHEIHLTTLEVMHQRYFRRDGAVLPARAMEDVFAEIEKTTKVETRWIAVNTRAMSISHAPQSEFEKEAAAELSKGKASHDRVIKGMYHRAGVIPLGPGCVGCHTRFGAPATDKPRVAGLVISIPVKEE